MAESVQTRVEEQRPPTKGKGRPLVHCPYCDYSAYGKQALGRHIHYSHPEKKKTNTPIEISSSTLKELVNLTTRLAAQDGDELSQSVQKVREEGISLRLKLIACAIDKANRVIQIAGLLRELDVVLFKKLHARIAQDPEGTGWTSEELVQLRKAFSSDINDDVTFLKGVLAIRDSGDDSFLERVATLLQRTSGVDGKIIAGRERIVELIEFGPNSHVTESDRDFVHGLMSMFDKRVKATQLAKDSIPNIVEGKVVDGGASQ